ncbi:hypothetical protein AOU00_04435 [Paenibacillus polymyxa]|nr:hypothetical protein AOU00_04435 [Paenibacillus polymyxa]KEO78465.1 hypothetical protein EL23_13065 [Paenibacillus polymyxa]KYG94361.1 hypothetical protein AZE31_11055 [Paenibacillus polymyxa]
MRVNNRIQAPVKAFLRWTHISEASSLCAVNRLAPPAGSLYVQTKLLFLISDCLTVNNGTIILKTAKKVK